MSHPRMGNPAVVVPGAMQALLGFSRVIGQTGLDEAMLELCHLRVSQINQCSVCVDLAGTTLVTMGVAPEKIVAVSAWRGTDYFTAPERAVLAVAEQVTRQADGTGGLSDTVYGELSSHFDETEIGTVLIHIGLVNLWNRINDSTRQVPTTW
jgi:AhpD family alkylhydroperoxidase